MRYTFPPKYQSIQEEPFVIVSPAGPYDGGNFGPNTPGTTTGGIQEALNAAVSTTPVSTVWVIGPQTITPTTTVNMKSGVTLRIMQGVTINGTGLSANIFTCSTITGFSIISEGLIETKAGYIAANVVGVCSQAIIELQRVNGKGGGVYVGGTSFDITASCKGENLGQAVTSGGVASTDGTPVYLDMQTHGCRVPYARNIDVSGAGTGCYIGEPGAWISGYDHQVDDVYAENYTGVVCTLGSVVGNANRTHDVTIGQITGINGNTQALSVQNCYRCSVGQVISYKAGMYPSANNETGVQFFANYQYISIGRIITSYCAADGVNFAIGGGDVNNCAHVSIGELISFDNGQNNATSTGVIFNANNANITDIYIGCVEAFDDQGTATQAYGIGLQLTSGYTLGNIVVERFSHSGLVTSTYLMNLNPAAASNVAGIMIREEPPSGQITNPVKTSVGYIGLGGSSAAVVASTAYPITGTNVYITSTGGTGVSITIKDQAGNTVASGLATLTALFLRVGYTVNFGAFTVAPTVTVFAA